MFASTAPALPRRKPGSSGAVGDRRAATRSTGADGKGAGAVQFRVGLAKAVGQVLALQRGQSAGDQIEPFASIQVNAHS